MFSLGSDRCAQAIRVVDVGQGTPELEGELVGYRSFSESAESQPSQVLSFCME